MSAPALDRLFIGVQPCGLVYCDRTRGGGDYLRLAFLPFRTLQLQWEGEDMPADMRSAIEQDAARMAEKRGQQYEVSACGQTVTLGK